MADERTEKQKVQEITDKLEEGLKELFESEKYKTYLSTMSKFHNYSFNNTLLIAMQKPEATLVAGYKAWQKNFERHVNKGEKAIRILAPAPYKIKEERDKLDPVTGEMMFDENGMPQKEQVEVTIPAFRAVSVFDVSQTDGKPIPELEAQELLSTVEGYEDFVQALMNVAPVPIGFEDIPGDSKGYFHTEEKRIAVQENMSESQTLKTMVHEVAHSMLHNKEINRDDLIEEPAKDRNTKEVEAESVAYTVCQHFGIDTSDYSFGYIAGWSSGKDMKELKSSLDTIRKTASELITGIEGALRELQLNREMEQEQSKECILLIQNEDLTEFSLVNVRGMDTQELVAALTNMNEDDKLSIQAYLESKGAWTTELGNDKTREFEEYHLDVRYNLDTDEIIDVKAKIAEQIDNNLSVMEQAEIDALPDPMIGLSEMREYGYTWNEMLPLTQEKALELFDHDLPVYLLHNDGSETTVDDRKQIMEHEGIFGIEKGDWENERKLRSMQAELSDNQINKEAQLLYGSSDKYGIYQLKHNPELDHLRFEGTESLKRMGITKDNFDVIKPENYELIYVGELSELQEQTQGETLEAIYEQFNIAHPEDYRGHSLSVSDIVVLHQNGKNSAHFVDSFGFTRLPDFMQTLEGVKEQEAEIDTSGHDVQKSEPEKQEQQTSDNTLEDGDEIIDLGDEKERVLADMKKSLELGEETELAFQIADRYISIQEVDGGYDYSIMGADYKELDGGVYDNPDVTIREALTDIVDDLKAAPDHNGAKGSIKEKDELIPIDYEGLMEKVEEANEVVPKNQESSIITDFRAKTNEVFHDISEMNPAEIEETIKCHVQAKIDEYDIDATIIDAVVVGSRCRGLEKDSSDLDVVVELSTNEREDDLFNAFNEDGLHIGEVKVDINPITAQRTGTLETYLPQAEKYLESIRQEREQELTQQMQTQGEMEKEEVEVTLMVSECGEFHNLGEFYENIPTVEEAIAIWKQIPPERMHGIPAIGINVHRPGEEIYMDDEVDLLSGNRIDLEILEHIPSITCEPKAMEVIAELVAKLPEMEIDGVMSEDMEAMVWEKRMPDLGPAEQLAVEIDRFSYDYDVYSYRNNNPNMTESVSEISEMIVQGNTEPITDWLNEVISEGALPDEMQRTKVLLEKLAEYKPLAKIEEMEEQNYNMIDNVLNNGAEKAQREANKKNQEQSAVKVSLKARLAEKKAQVEGSGQEHEVQENTKKNQREI
ncbi:YodL domain-containing protein [Gallintestinimicrobium propionicum]|uniref:SsDNA-binding domain-containing protein n=1 Tax=Gallintestinimicrobium propionicum TaxID=2981770 RepID=A0AAE3DMZ3_9FIRM|nr:YodL domain-containing protein [Gallintestinimicrobium propionicum]MCC2166818.1 ssDNA-binding domain-containing protein [Gallintestinimicrobium propionicum]